VHWEIGVTTMEKGPDSHNSLSEVIPFRLLRTSNQGVKNTAQN